MIKSRQSVLRSALIGAAVLCWATSVLAQDTRPFNWTGFYLGGHAGGAWQDAQRHGYSDANIQGFHPHSFPGISTTSAMGGIYGGYNWQVNRQWVLGVEADGSLVSLRDGSNLPLPPGGLDLASRALMSTNIDGLASIRGRLGLAADKALFYVTGGAAWAQVDYNGRLIMYPGFSEAAASSKVTVPGWVVGAGFEWALLSNWAIRGEYLYYGLSAATSFSAEFLPKPCLAGPPATCDAPARFSWSDTNIQVLRVGLAYKF